MEDITIENMHKQLADGSIYVENASLTKTHYGKIIRDIGGKPFFYNPIIHEGKYGERYIENSGGLTIIGIRNNKFLCSDMNGIIYEVGSKELDKIRMYGLYITNTYAVEKENVLTVLDYTEEIDIRVQNFTNKCKLLGLEVPIIKNIDGNMTLVSMVKNIDRFKVPDFVTHIGDSAFFRSEIHEIVLPDNLKYIGKNVFNSCRKLKFIRIPKTVQKIGCCAFKNSGLEEVVIEGDIGYLEDLVFEDCNKLDRLSLSNAVRSIGVGTFRNCYKLSGINTEYGSSLEDKLIHIGAEAFYACVSFDITKLRDTVESIHSTAFDGRG